MKIRILAKTPILLIVLMYVVFPSYNIYHLMFVYLPGMLGLNSLDNLASEKMIARIREESLLKRIRWNLGVNLLLLTVPLTVINYFRFGQLIEHNILYLSFYYLIISLMWFIVTFWGDMILAWKVCYVGELIEMMLVMFIPESLPLILKYILGFESYQKTIVVLGILIIGLVCGLWYSLIIFESKDVLKRL